MRHLGILCGVVTEFELNPGDNFYTAKIKLSVDFSNLTQIYLVDNLMKKEQIKEIVKEGYRV